MSSLANAIKRKTHKERAQPSSRQKYGLLEKRKDYLLRARDFHKKEEVIKTLREKAAERNPDEFYFAMEKARTKNGVHQVSSSEPNKYTQEELALMKTQDVKYLSLRQRIEAEKIKRLKNSLHFIGIDGGNKHTVFVDDQSEAQKFDPAEYFDTPADLLTRKHNRPRKADMSERPLALNVKGVPMKHLRKAEKSTHAVYAELQQRIQRHDKVGKVADKLAYDKVLMGKGRKLKLAASEPGKPVYRWKRERSK